MGPAAMTPDEIRDIIRQEHAINAMAVETRMREIVSTSVKETLVQLGISQADPLEFQKDMAHLRKWRLAVDGAASKTALMAMTVLITGMLGAFWVGFKAVLVVK